jgi:bifunctional DNA-binding transcriptional regulator/antitoxin component of YhaV-PrlF toxin-antitoxin module
LSKQETFVKKVMGGNRVTIPYDTALVLNIRKGDMVKIIIEKIEEF